MDITQEKLRDLLIDSEPQNIDLVTVTDAGLRKTGNPLKTNKVEKKTVGRFMFGTSYIEQVNEALKNEGIDKKYESKPLPWGQWVEGGENKVIENKSKLYLRYYPTDSIAEVNYMVDGQPATKEQLEIIKNFLPNKKSSTSSTQSEAGLSKEKQIVPLVVSFDSIKSIAINSIEYKLNN